VPESVVSFHSLPPEYQTVIQKAEQKFQISISPLQEIAGGWSGAFVYLVRVTSTDSGRVEHLILKLDRLRRKMTSDEISRHKTVQDQSPDAFSSQHIPQIVYDRVEAENALAIFYSIAGQSLHQYRTLSKFRRQSRLMKLFETTNHIVLEKWNAGKQFEQIDHPADLIKRWLGFRLDAGQKIDDFITNVCMLPAEIPGFIVQGEILPNPVYYTRNPDIWDKVRPGTAIVGMQHSDLNTNNILAKFIREETELEGYYLIDFALFKEQMPLLFDQRYLEMSYLVNAIANGSLNSAVDLIVRMSQHAILEPDQTPIEMGGVNAAIRAGRMAFKQWQQDNHPSLYDDLWGQYWLAGAAAGLSFTHKAGTDDHFRLAGLIYAAANLKQYFTLFGIPMPAEASQLYPPALSETTASRHIPTGSPRGKPRHNLPAPPTKFIGRAESMENVTGLLLQPEVRLVTLTGPGGTGKTRLSLEIGRSLLDHFRHGVFFIDLAKVTDPALVLTTTAHTLGIREGGGVPSIEKLKDYLGSRQILLIFDNFEQVTAAAPDLAELLSDGQGLKALVTSRIPLKLRWEHEYPVTPLDMPEKDALSLEETAEVESVALFLQQAKAVRPNFKITDENVAAVVEICRHLDGLPLAIEIAAARIRMLSPQALQKRLDESLSLLVGGSKDLPTRQQTLRQTIDWSYQLLEPEARNIFIQLGVFAGGFTLESAEAVCSSDDAVDVFAAIETLLDSSLLRQVQSVTDEPRFDMLQTIREFAREKAEEAGLLDELRWAHLNYFASVLGGSLSGQGAGRDSGMWLEWCEEEHDNFRAALAWGMDHPEEGTPFVIIIMGELIWFWYRYGYLQEGSEWTERGLSLVPDTVDSIPRASALVGRAYLALWSGELLLAAKLAGESVEMSERIGYELVLPMAKLCYGTALINLGKDRKAYPHLVDAVELYDQQGITWMKGTTLVHLANVSLGLGDHEQATKWLDMAMPFMYESSDPWSIAFGLNNYGEIARTLGNYDAAEEYYRQTEELFKQADAKGDHARLIHSFAYIAQHKGDYDKARDLFLESLNDFRVLGNHRGIAECLAGLAGLASVRGRNEWAVPLLSAAEANILSFGGVWWPADRVEINRTKEQMQSSLGEAYQTLWDQGQSMSVDDAIHYAIQGAGQIG
jgi:predicted ATPase